MGRGRDKVWRSEGFLEGFEILHKDIHCKKKERHVQKKDRGHEKKREGNKEKGTRGSGHSSSTTGIITL